MLWGATVRSGSADSDKKCMARQLGIAGPSGRSACSPSPAGLAGRLALVLGCHAIGTNQAPVVCNV